MDTVAVKVRRRDSQPPNLEADLVTARFLARLLDSEFSIAGIRFGLDAIVGLVPVLGDALSAIAGMYPIWVARRHHFSRTVQMRMWANLAIDFLAGLVPVVGDVVDVAFKANLKNLKILEAAAARRASERNPAG